jgi:DMSO/TMAO reductase YedYZ molybdopterin-dependent catalytic subunit
MSMLVIDGPATAGARELDWNDVDAEARGEFLVEHTERLSDKVRGEGVALARLLASAPLLDGASHAIVHGGGDYRACLTLAECRTAVLAHRLDGAPLPAQLGGPLRLLVPSAENKCLSVKAVHRIVITRGPEPDTVPRPTTQLRKLS